MNLCLWGQTKICSVEVIVHRPTTFTLFFKKARLTAVEFTNFSYSACRLSANFLIYQTLNCVHKGAKPGPS